MANLITSLGFTIYSTFNSKGVKEAKNQIDGLDKKTRELNQSFNAAGGNGAKFGAILTGVAPSAIMLSGVLVGVSSAIVASSAAMGVAGGAYGAVLSQTIKKTLEMQKAGEALSPSQVAFVNRVDAMKKAWTQFLVAHAPQTLSVARDGIDGIIAGISKLNPLIDATHPIIKKTSEAWKGWMEGDGSTRFIDTIITHGVPALDLMRQAGVNVLDVFGTGFRTIIPYGDNFAQMLLNGSEALKRWADGGGFQKFMDYVVANQGLVKEFFAALLSALQNVFKAIADMGPGMLVFVTRLLEIIAAMPTEYIKAFLFALSGLHMLTVITGIVGSLTAAFKLFGVVMDAIATAGAIIKWIGMLTTSLHYLAFAMGLSVGWIVIIIVAVAALVAAIIWIATKTTWFQDAWSWLWENIKKIAKPIIDWFVNTWETVWPIIQDTAKVVWDWIVNTWNALWAIVQDTARKVWDWISIAWGTMITSIQDIWITVSAVFMSTWDSVWNTIKSVASTVWDALKTAWEFLGGVFKEAYDGLIKPVVDAFKNVWPEVQAAVTNAWSAISYGLEKAWNFIVGLFKWAWGIIGPIVEFYWDLIVSVFTMAFNVISTIVKFGWDIIVSIFTAVWDVISATVTLGWNVVISIFRYVWDVLFAAGRAFGSIFLSIWEPIWNVVVAVFTAVWEIIKAVWRVVVDAVEATLLVFLAFFTGHWGKAWDAIKDLFESVWNAVKVIFESVWNVMKAIFMAGVDFIVSVWQAVWRFIGDYVDAAWNAVGGIIGAVWDYISSMWQAGMDFLSSVWTAVWEFIKSYIVAWWSGVTDIFNTVLTFLKGVWETAWGGISDFFIFLWTSIKDYFVSTWEIWKSYAVAAFQFLSDLWTTVWTYVSAFFITLWVSIKDFFVSTWEALKSYYEAVFKILSDAWTALWTSVRDFISGVLATIVQFFKDRWEDVKNVFQSFSDWIVGTFWTPLSKFFTETIPAAFDTAVNAIKTAWEKVKEFVRAPIQAIIDVVYNGGIVNAWNLIATKFGADELKPYTMPAWKDGGPVRGPGTGTSDSIIGRVSNGEHVWTKREVDAAGGHGAVAALRQYFVGGGVRVMGDGNGRYAEGGGVWDTILGYLKVGGAVQTAGPKQLDELALGAIYPVAEMAINKARDLGAEAIRALMPGDDTAWEGLAIGAISKMASTVLEWIKPRDVAPALSGSGGAGVAGSIPTGDRAAIITSALAAAGIPPPGTMNDWLIGMNTLIERESGWNPNSVNLWDVNAQNGVPSGGLAQVIGPTFQAYRVPSLPNNVFDPIANVAASARYIVSRYGNITNVQQANANLPPLGYALGTPGARAGMATVAENGMELVTRGPVARKFKGGEKVWNNKETMGLLSGSGKSGDTHISIDMRNSTKESVEHAERSLVPKLLEALDKGTGKRF